MFYFKLLLLAAASKEEKIKLAPEQTAFGTLMPKVWLHCPVCPCGYGQAQLFCCPGKELQHGPSLSQH